MSRARSNDRGGSSSRWLAACARCAASNARLLVARSPRPGAFPRDRPDPRWPKRYRGWRLSSGTASRRRQNYLPRYSRGGPQCSSGSSISQTQPKRACRGGLGTRGNSSEQFRRYALADPVEWTKLVGERLRSWAEKTGELVEKTRGRAAFFWLAHAAIGCQTGSSLFFRRGASIDAVQAQALPRELCPEIGGLAG